MAEHLSGRAISHIYIAAGQLWLAQRTGSASRLIDTARIGKHAALYTPAWSPSGEEIAFASWDPDAGGHVWRYTLRTGALHRVTQQAGRYLYPVWNRQADALAYLHNAEPPRLTPQMFLSPFSDGAWHVVIQAKGGQQRKAAQTQRPHAISFGLDGRLRYLTQVRDSQSMASSSFPASSILTITPHGYRMRFRIRMNGNRAPAWRMA